MRLILVALSLMLSGGDCRCGERLERALDLMQQRGSSARRRYDNGDDSDVVYREKLRSAPIEVSVTKIQVEIPSPNSSSSSSSRDNLAWAKVERCAYEPSNNSIRTRVAFNELAVTGLVRLVAHEPGVPSGRRLADRLLPAESCRMSLRLRRAGMEFYTSPIARGRGQMRIRTESSFLEPRFASIYAYGCRPVTSPVRRPFAAYIDRDIDSEPRGNVGVFPGLLLASNDYNSVFNSSAFDNDAEDEDVQHDEGVNGEEIDEVAGVIGLANDEENRLGDNADNDAILDNLWRSRGDIAREMEDVFLRSASQAITHYIERQLHPAIKETLMLSMGYTISYG